MSKQYKLILLIGGGILFLLSILFLPKWHINAATQITGVTELISVSSSGEQGNRGSDRPSISADGRFVAFTSRASNLVSGDTNGSSDIFVHDRRTGVTERVSVSSSREQGNGWSSNPSISAFGRFVAFHSSASNLVSGDTNGTYDIFVHDRQNGVTERVSVSSSGVQANGGSLDSSISADGRFVAFYTYASNLVSGDTNGRWDIFVHDRHTGVTERVSTSSSGEQGNYDSLFPSISGNGRFVAFQSYATNLVSGDTNGEEDIFVHNRQTGVTKRVSVSSKGEQGNDHSWFSSISGNGHFVVFQSAASNLVSGDTNGVVDIFIHERHTGVTERVSVSSNGEQGNSWSTVPFISTFRRFVVFESYASNLVSGDTNGEKDIFVRDCQSGVTELISVSSSSDQGNNSSDNPSISADARFVAFDSGATNLVLGDTNGDFDVFVRDRYPDVPMGGNNSYLPLIWK